MAALGQPTRVSAGCGSASSPDTFECSNGYTCEASYECGGQSAFVCVYGYTCSATFDCVRNFVGPS